MKLICISNKISNKIDSHLNASEYFYITVGKVYDCVREYKINE